MPYKITPFEGWEVDFSGNVPRRPCCPTLSQRCNHIVFRKQPSCMHEMAGPLAPYALEWELDTESNPFYINSFTGRVIGEGTKGGYYLTTDQFDPNVNQLFMAQIKSPNGSIICLPRARMFFEEEEQPLGVIFFHDQKYMRPFLDEENGERWFYVVFLPSSPIQTERLDVWHGDIDREGLPPPDDYL